MKFLGVAAIASLASFTSALPIKASTVLSFEMAGINGPKPDIHNQIPLETLESGQLAIADSKDGSASPIKVTIKPWMEGELLGINSDGKENGQHGYLVQTDQDKLYDLKYGNLPSGDSGVLTKGFYPAEDHPAAGAEGIEQLFYSNGEIQGGSFLYESNSAEPHPIKWYASNDKIPEGYTQVWLTRPIKV
ncbi:hypothetical protein KEM54_005706 [Ascosphaera aggregata]|nr:hypothetical protein KEM54_005706 [Ascosphaera aggregata]